jgi:hypothetical protein
MTNRELYFRDPTTIELLNNGVSKVSEIGHDERQVKTLRFELETFVCDGEYARGLERISMAEAGTKPACNGSRTTFATRESVQDSARRPDPRGIR